jgi:hypothetical protein
MEIRSRCASAPLNRFGETRFTVDFFYSAKWGQRFSFNLRVARTGGDRRARRNDELIEHKEPQLQLRDSLEKRCDSYIGPTSVRSSRYGKKGQTKRRHSKRPE